MCDRVEVRDDVGVSVEARSGCERAVGFDGDAVDRPSPLRNETFERSPHRELRRGGQLGKAAQHQRGRGGGVVMRETADRGRHSGHEDSVGHEPRRIGLGLLSIEAERAVVSLWCARLFWVVLPLSAGTALSDALSGWSVAPARVAAVLLWTAWALGLVALLAPRPWGLTALRVVAPAAVIVAVVSIGATSAASAALGVSSSVVAAAFALSSSVAQASGNAMAYGDEIRFPFRVPLSLFVGPVPLAVALIGAGVSVGPLLFAARHYIAGAIVTVAGVAIAVVLVRSLHSLALRWVVLVPAGLVVVDPLSLADPVLMRREQIVGVKQSRKAATDAGGIDLRLGTLPGTIELSLREPQSFARRRGRRDSELRDADVVLVSTVRANALVQAASDRRIAIA